MATRAETFRYEQERSKPKLPPKPKKPRLNVGTKHARGTENGTRNEHTSAKGDRKAVVVLEENFSGHASRKSTRKSANGHRGGEMLEVKRIMDANRPTERHGRRGG